MINIRELLEDPSKLNADTLPELKALVEKYPFFQVVRLLYISNLYKLHSQDFGAELRKASSFVPDRTALFTLTEGINYTLPTHSNDINIETDEDESPRREQPSQMDLLTDYASYLMQLDDQEAKDAEKAPNDAPKLRGAELIDSFIEENKGKQRVDIPDMDESEFSSPEFSVEEEEVYTENMVNIYIKQGRYQQALEILRKISLNNPKKSSNFAAQIYLLEVLLKQNQ